jgi:hypothetical protein
LPFIPGLIRLDHNSKFNFLVMQEKFIIEHSDSYTQIITYLSHSPQTPIIIHYVLPTWHARLESSAISDYGLGPHLSTSCGDMLSLFCLCVAPGWFVRRRFTIAEAFPPWTLSHIDRSVAIFGSVYSVRGFPLASYHHNVLLVLNIFTVS